MGNGVSPISSPRTQEPGVLLSEGREKMNVPAQPESKLALFLSLFFHSGPQRSGGSSPAIDLLSDLTSQVEGVKGAQVLLQIPCSEHLALPSVDGRLYKNLPILLCIAVS